MRPLIQVGLLSLAVASLAPERALAIPAFARRYRVSCAMCHVAIPKLNAFGDRFAANGYRMSPAEEPKDTIGVGDKDLALLKELPLAVRLDAYAQAYANGKVVTDFQAPYGLKFLSGGPISKKLSYYFYAFLAERGEVTGIEDAFLYLNDLGSAKIDLVAGQFQVSDPLFKRELRLELEDYVIYRARMGEVPVNLTYERGLMASAEVGGFDLTGMVVNGNGIGVAQSDRHFDDNAPKNFMGRISREFGSKVRLGGFGYTGRSTSGGVRDDIGMLGVDGTFQFGPVEINGQYVHRQDTRPTFHASEPKATMQGGFAEVIVHPSQSRFYGFGLYNLVTSDAALLNPRMGGPANVDRYESISIGAGHLVRRNVRVSLETTYDTQQEAWRWSLGFVTAF